MLAVQVELLTGRYVAPWVPNLRNINTAVLTALYELFGAPPVTDGKAPEAKQALAGKG